MEKTREYNKLSSNISRGQDLTTLDLRDQNDIINNETEERTRKTSFKRKKRKRERKKKMASIPLQKNNTRTDIETNDSNKSRSSHLANNISILPKTTDLLSTSTEEDKRAGNTIDKNTSKNLLKDTEKASGMKKEDREIFNSLQQDDKRTDINNLIDKVHTLQLIRKKDNDNASVSSKTDDLSNTAKHDAGDRNNTSNSTLQSSSTQDVQEDSSCTRKRRNRRAYNFLQKNGKQIGLQTDNVKDKEQTILQLDNCNNISPKTADLSSTNAVEHESIEDMNDKGISTLQSSKFIFSDINFDFHEANHAIIETFAINIYSLCADDRKTYCLLCDKNFRIKNNNLQKHLCRHIRSGTHIRLLSQMIEDDKNSLKAGRLFSELGLARECMRSKNNIVECLLCSSKDFSSKVQNDDLSLQEHILSSTHQNFKLFWTPSIKDILQDIHNYFRSVYNAKKYCCEFCSYESTSETCFAKHLRVPYHTTRLVEISDHREKFKFYYCDACQLLWFGSSNMYDQHCEQTEHMHRIINYEQTEHLHRIINYEQTEHIHKTSSDVDHLPKQIVQLLIMANQNAEAFLMQSNSICYDKMLNYILCDFITELQKYIPNIKAYPFGSRISDLGFPDSDLDIFLDCGNMYEGSNSSYHHCQDLITHIVHYLSLNKTIWKVQEVILHSRTPIIKVQHNPSGLICDVSVTNGLAVENTKIIKCFNHAFPLCRKMILFLKQWLHSSGLSGSRVITNYALTWCIIFYLQTLSVFPSISQLIKLKNRSWRISGWEVGVSYNFPVKKINYTFEELLLGFFMFYADFTCKSHVICPLLGQPIEKSAFTNLSSLPQDMAPYIAYMHDACTKKKPEAFFISSLCVQDPFDLSHNLTKAVHIRKLNKFQKYCNSSAKILKKTFPYLKSPLLYC